MIQLNISKFFNKRNIDLPLDQLKQLQSEKLIHMVKMAKESLLPAFLGPIICLPLFAESAGYDRFYLWFIVANICLLLRAYLVLSTNPQMNIDKNILKMNWAIGLSSACWGFGWLILLPTYSLENYLLYYTITLIFVFINMYGNCLNWSTLVSFIAPLQICLFVYYFFIPNAVVHWPIVTGAALFFYYSLKMGSLFSLSWEKNLILKFKNDALLDELIIEKDTSIAANTAKSDFIATASHDLRQPMQAINIFLALLNDQKMDEDEKLIVGKLKFSADQLNKMFNALLDISKLDAQSILVKDAVFDLSVLASNLQGVLAPIASAKKLELNFKYQHIKAYGDMTLLTQLLMNIISNAIQYTQSGSIDVLFTQDANMLVVQVRDTGMGMGKEDLNSMYKEFYRGQYTRGLHDGLGLGLSIVNRIIKLIGATLSVESDLGKGSAFTVKTHFSTITTNDLLDKTPAANQILGDDYSAFTLEDSQRLHLGHLAIIEDDDVLLNAYYQFFTAAGFVVHLIPLNAEEFYSELTKISRLDFILSDYRLGSENGVSYIQKIREQFNADIPAIIVTADTSPEHLKMFDDLSIKALYKPIEPSEIVKHIKK